MFFHLHLFSGKSNASVTKSRFFPNAHIIGKNVTRYADRLLKNMENPLKNNPVGTKKCMERPGRDSMLYAWNNGKKEPVPEFEGQAKFDHTNVEVGDAWKGHGRMVVKPAEVWVGSGGKQTGRDSMQNRSVLHGSSCKPTRFAR